jgi:uncharacterized membrane protein YidH (DUF202 family)
MKRREPEIWGTTKRRRLPLALLVAGGGLGLIATAVGLGTLLAMLVRILLSTGSPLAAAACLGGVVIAGLAVGIMAVRAAARRFADGSSARRAVTLGGLVLLMALAPFMMIVVVVVLALQGG